MRRSVRTLPGGAPKRSNPRDQCEGFGAQAGPQNRKEKQNKETENLANAGVRLGVQTPSTGRGRAVAFKPGLGSFGTNMPGVRRSVRSPNIYLGRRSVQPKIFRGAVAFNPVVCFGPRGSLMLLALADQKSTEG